MAKILAVIPARGGSTGIPRKNLRQLSGVPLIAYTIKMARASRFEPRILVSSEDQEILAVAKLFGAETHCRDEALADAITTLDPVVYSALSFAERESAYEIVATLQPTSPLLQTKSFDEGIVRLLEKPHLDTIISVHADAHLRWTVNQATGYAPLYQERVNRQQLAPVFRETGAFLISRRQVITPHSRIGAHVDLVELAAPENIDIDNFDDFALCQHYLNRRHIVFVLKGHEAIGMGHVNRALTLASHLVDHRLTFFLDADSELGARKVAANNYTVVRPTSSDWVDDVVSLAPDLVINDQLDTSATDIQRLKASSTAVINFEDLGGGAFYADRVINELYPSPENDAQPGARGRIYFGPAYFCARDEFRFMRPKQRPEKINKVLVTFGGTDPSHLTEKVLRAIVPLCLEHEIDLSVILGVGVKRPFDAWTGHVAIQQDVRNMAEHMQSADIVFTSAGRTVFELAAVGVPGVILAQNAREMTHSLAGHGFGFIKLGLGETVSEDAIRQCLQSLIADPDTYTRMFDNMKPGFCAKGVDRVVAIIRDTLVQHRIEQL